MRTDQATKLSPASHPSVPIDLLGALLHHSSTAMFLSGWSRDHIEMNEQLREMLGSADAGPLREVLATDGIAGTVTHNSPLPAPPVIREHTVLRRSSGEPLSVEIIVEVFPGYFLGTVHPLDPAESPPQGTPGTATGVGIITFDLNNHVTGWNPAAADMLGLGATELSGTDIRHLVSPDGRRVMTDLLGQVKKGEHVDHFETFFSRKDGLPFDVVLSLAPFRSHRKILGGTMIARVNRKGVQAVGPARPSLRLAEKADELEAAHMDLHQAARGLIDQRHQYYELFDTIPYGHIITDKYGAITDINRSALRMLGLEKPFADRLPILVFIAPKDQSLIRTILLRMQRGTLDDVKEIDMSMQPDNGKLQPFAASLTVTATKHEGVVTGLHWTIRDVTERRQAEKALRRSERRFRGISEASSDFAYSITVGRDRTLSVSWFTKALETITGLPSSLLCQPNGWHWLCHPHDKGIFEEHLKNLLAGNSDVCEYRIVTSSGGVRWLRDSAQPRRDSRNRIVEIVGGAQDITERKLAEEALRESEERFRMTFYSIGDGVITTDTHGAIVRMNRLAESLTGWSETAARGLRIQEVFRTVDDASGGVLEDPVARVLREGNEIIQTDHMVLVDAKGKERPISANASPIRDARGDPTGVVLVFHDQSELKDLQDKLLLSHKMDAIGRFAGGVAHDFNNVLSIILGLATLIKRSLQPSDPLHGQIDTILNAAERSANLTKQLLAFARNQVVAPVPVNLNNALSSLLEMLRRFVGEDISLQLIPGQTLWNIRIDPGQVDQILTNLTANARDAIADVGSITIETRNTTITRDDCRGKKNLKPGEYVLLSLTDTGKGMDETVLPRIFDPFFTTKPRDKGTGLGLPTVFGIVKQNNGLVDVESRPGEGTSFRIYFPRFRGEVEVPAGEPEEVSLKGTETILVVEDEEQILNLFAQTLQDLEYNVIKAKSPAQAITLCREYEGHIHLLVTDVIMPGMNGRELAQHLAGFKPMMKVIYNSGYAAHMLAQRGIIDQGIRFLQKPFTPMELARNVREVLNA